MIPGATHRANATGLRPYTRAIKNVAMMQKNVRSVSEMTLFPNKKPQ
jgi:hypothetical protein